MRKVVLRFLALSVCASLANSPSAAQTGRTPPQHERMTPYQEESLKIERVKAGGTIAAIFVPLILGVLTLRSQTKTAFRLKAIEVVMQSPTPWVAEKRAQVMERAFPQLKEFGRDFDFNDFPGLRLHDMKLELIRLLAAHPQERKFIFTQWEKLFPGEGHKFGIETPQPSPAAHSTGSVPPAPGD